MTRVETIWAPLPFGATLTSPSTGGHSSGWRTAPAGAERLFFVARCHSVTCGAGERSQPR
jgi:hypothetical protein